jgi:hypothetical protein
MSKCPKCNATLSCGCQKRVVNGVQGCSKCLSNSKNTPKVLTPVNANPKTTSNTLNPWGKDRYKNLQKFTK